MPRIIQSRIAVPGPAGTSNLTDANINAAATTINAKLATLKAMQINVKDYGAVGDGVTDDSAAVQAAATALANSARADLTAATAWGRVLTTGILYFPPGSYKITTDTAIMVNNATAGMGYRVLGAGRETTTIMFAPTSAKYLVRNVGTGWQHVGFSDMTITMENANASFMYTDSVTNQRDFTFERVNWRGFGTANYGFRNIGADNYDTFSFWHCAVYGVWNTFFWVEGSDQAVCHGFHDFTWEVSGGNMIRMTKGGNVNLYGASIVQVGAGTVFYLEGAGHSYGACRLIVSGARIELHYTSQLIKCEWNLGTVTFASVDISTQSFSVDPSTVNTVFQPVGANGSIPLVQWIGCSLQGRHQYSYDNNSTIWTSTVLYERCELTNYASVHAFIAITDVGGNGAVGGAPVIRFRGCRNNGQVVIADTDLNWNTSIRGETTRKVMSVKQAFGFNPFNGGYEDAVLPMNAVVVGARLYAPGTGWIVIGGSTTAWTMKFQSTEATPTVLLTAAPGTLPSAGFNVLNNTIMHVCNSDAKRTIRLVADANIKDYNAGFVGIIEYIG